MYSIYENPDSFLTHIFIISEMISFCTFTTINFFNVHVENTIITSSFFHLMIREVLTE